MVKTDLYKFKNNTIFSTCIECFNKKVNCELCNKEFKGIYLSKHIERCLIKKVRLNDNDYLETNKDIKLLIMK